MPLQHQARFCRSIEDRIAQAFPGRDLLVVGHIGDGNLHVIVQLHPDTYEGGADGAAMRADMTQINDIVDEVTLALGGTISAEHGIGQSNKRRLLASRGPDDIALMQRIKHALDPLALMNPGKVFDPAPLG